MTNPLLPVERDASLAAMSFKDAPDYLTAYHAAIAHGLSPKEALKSAHMKWMQTNAEEVERFGLANFYNGRDENQAMIDLTLFVQFLTIVWAEQNRQVTELREEIAALRTQNLLPET